MVAGAIKKLLDADGAYVVIDEGESMNLQVTLKDAADATIDAATVTSITFDLYDKETTTTINSRAGVDVKNANNATVTASILTIRLDPADATIVTTANHPAGGQPETHVARVIFTYSDGTATRTGRKRVQFGVAATESPT